ncbi:DUF1471 domain-containing protein [Salmonella enterica]|uniref:DUF1471 domain-containing protein n=1 Tax=Salmonella enterica TaxID=28901 RepID=A0A759RPF6_SALER|nr:DUF1471 domain-containing protein [Salmonella enterica subsp. enterica serovar Hvittingfoss]EDI0467619.1 hypothetical protein [Salmonella enterica subsp. enterica serovar Newport]EGF6523933.1 DUF1471 domain-containing protein [Salmonella enterica]EHL2774327.1 DUF1471 domain-containing protein [Salmonella enterica subsp. enterica serovar Hvittingfoss]EHL2852475.1 DUF1471 domain-containing protein [Salmonella enterica subsp. enterica serovar Hvittingfoss]
MKSVKMFLVAVVLGAVSVPVFAAMETTMPQGMTRIGTVSDSSGATTLSDLKANLAAKAQAEGASFYRIIAAGGKNTLHGSAVIYK